MKCGKSDGDEFCATLATHLEIFKSKKPVDFFQLPFSMRQTGVQGVREHVTLKNVYYDMKAIYIRRKILIAAFDLADV